MGMVHWLISQLAHFEKMSRCLTRTNLSLALITALAAAFRWYRIDQLPPGFQFDQAFYVSDALQLLHGEFAIFFYQPGRSEPLYQYLLMPFIAFFGADSSLGLKIAGGLIGILSVPLVFGITHTLYRDVRIGLIGALLTAISFWHIFYSRYGERIPLTLLMAILSFWFVWRALARVSAPRQTRTFALAGVFTGLTLYTYPAGRIVPLAIALLIAYAMLTDRTRARDYFKGLVILTTIALGVFAPLGIYYIQHPIDFFSHAADVSIFVPHGAISDNLPLELGKNALKILGMFFIVGDGGVLRNLPYRPIFDPLVGTLFVIGVMVWLDQLVSPQSSRVERWRAVFLMIWLGLALTLSLISDDAPNNGRVLIGLPVVMILPAWGAVTIWDRLRARLVRRGAAMTMSAILLISATLVYRDYFITLANDPGTYYAFDTDKVELANWLAQNAPRNHIYLAPLLAQNGTISLLTRHAALKSFESRDTIVLPSNASGKDALFVFPWEQTKKIQTMAERLGLGTRTELTGTNGGILALIYRIPADNLPHESDPLATLAQGGTFIQPQKIEHAPWNDAFELLGYSIDAADVAKRNVEVILFVRALKPMSEEYTFSIKVRDAQDRVWGQEDKWLGNNSYATTQWSPGEIVIEKFYPGLNACAPAGEYRLSVEAYNPKTMQSLGKAIDLGIHRADASLGNLYEHLEPAQVVQAGPLFGYTLTPDVVRAGGSFSLALFWRGVGKGQETQHLTVTLRDAAQHHFLLRDQSFGLPNEGRGLCTFFDFSVSPDAAPGLGSIWVNETKIATIDITR